MSPERSGPGIRQSGERRRGDQVRRVLQVLLVVVGTLGLFCIGVSGAWTTPRVVGVAVGVLAAVGAVLLARRRDNVIGWFAALIVVGLFRVVVL